MRNISAFIANLGLVAATSAAAQGPAPMAFVHGINSSGSTWGTTPSNISAHFNLTTFQPNLSSFSFFDVQANQLRTNIGIQPPNLVAIGHSNGGIVSRRAAAAQPMQGIITVGTPHLGADLATNTMNGVTFQFLEQWSGNIVAAPVQYFAYVINDFCQWVCPEVYNGVVTLLGGAFDALFEAGYQLALQAAPVARATTVLGEMEPGGPFIFPVLNSQANLQSEAASIPIVRKSIVSQGWPYHTSMFIGLTPGNEHHNTAWQMVTAGTYYAFWEYYYDYTDYGDPDMWDKRLNSGLWLLGYYELLDTDYNWCNLVGGWSFLDGFCRSDGIVAGASQYWPQRTHELAFFATGAGHLNQTNNPLIQTFLLQALQGDGFVLPPPANPPPSPLTPSITGPAFVWPGQGCFWTGSASGGIPPYTFSWAVGGAQVGSVPSLQYTNEGYDFELQLTVTDGAGTSSTAARTVYVIPDITDPCQW